MKKKIAEDAETSKIIIDEWDIQAAQSLHRRAIRELIAKEKKIFTDIVYANCWLKCKRKMRDYTESPYDIFTNLANVRNLFGTFHMLSDFWISQKRKTI